MIYYSARAEAPVATQVIALALSGCLSENTPAMPTAYKGKIIIWALMYTNWKY